MTLNDFDARIARRFDNDIASAKVVRDEMTAAALAIPCPTCGTQAGFRCFTMATGRSTYTATHARRFRNANKAI